MDDVAWSEPAPRRRRGAAELDPPAWIQSAGAEFADVGPESEPRAIAGRPARERRHDGRRFEARRSAEHLAAPVDYREPGRPIAGFRAEAYLDQRDYAAELAGGWDTTPAAEPVVIEYTDPVDEEAIWGPRPRLHAEESGGRRTVVITGRGADRAMLPPRHSRADLPVSARHGFQADRTAMWAVLLCVLLLLAAIASH